MVIEGVGDAVDMALAVSVSSAAPLRRCAAVLRTVRVHPGLDPRARKRLASYLCVCGVRFDDLCLCPLSLRSDMTHGPKQNIGPEAIQLIPPGGHCCGPLPAPSTAA